MSGEPVVIREYRYEHEALLAQSRLEEEGIPAVLLRTSLSHMILEPAVRLAVRADSVAVALEVLADDAADV